MAKRRLHSPKLPSRLGAYSAVEVSRPTRMLYVSGLTIPKPADSVHVVGDLRA
ncbi:MAG: hypothetical protein JO247_22245 [Chloroflexi bacterium]|nr:hypothetical protein [Chloroflexota bacterium]